MYAVLKPLPQTRYGIFPSSPNLPSGGYVMIAPNNICYIFQNVIFNCTISSLFFFWLSLTIKFWYLPIWLHIPEVCFVLLLINIPLFWVIFSFLVMYPSGFKQDTEIIQFKQKNFNIKIVNMGTEVMQELITGK